MVSPNNVVADALRSAREELLAAIEVAKKESVDATARLAELVADLESCERMIPIMEGRSDPRAGGIGIHSHIRPSQLLGSTTERDAWRRMASLTEGQLVRPTDGAQLLIDAKVGGNEYRKVRSNALSWMSNSHEWASMGEGEGIYRYLGKDGMGLLGDAAGGNEERCQEDLLPINDGDASDPSSPVSPETPDVLGRITV